MKKLSLLLVVCLILTAFGAAFAEKFDITPIMTYQDYLNVSYADSDGSTNMFVESIFGAYDRSFEHSRESEYAYSTISFELVVADLNGPAEQAWFTLWINVCSDDGFHDLDTVTFNVAGNNYTFTAVSDPDWYYVADRYYLQRLRIVFNQTNCMLLDVLEDYYRSFTDSETRQAEYCVPVVFSGADEITGVFDYDFGLECLLFSKLALESNTLDYHAATIDYNEIMDILNQMP